MKKKLLKAILSVVLPGLVSFIATAQKLPNIQPTSLRAPAGIKIDGKAMEWGAQYQAYNHATDIFYTISNDDENLYLLVRATDPSTINFKILAGGLSFVIQKTSKKDDKDRIGITYPIVRDDKTLNFRLVTGKGRTPDTTGTASAVKYNNNILEQRCKWIAVSGIRGLDTISAYNEDGIHAAGLFDINKAYTLEFSISLKQLGIQKNETEKIYYHILLNGSTKPVFADGAVVHKEGANIDAFIASLQSTGSTMFAPVDFWGEYTLAKK